MLTCNLLCAAGVERRDRTEQKRKEKKRDRTEKKREEKRQNRTEQNREGKKRKEKKRFPLSSFHQNNCRSDTRHLKMNILFGYYILRLPRLCSHSTLIDYHNVSSVTAH